MRNKKIKAIRKQLGLKLPVTADLRVVKEVDKISYFTMADGTTKAVPVKKQVIVNASKYQYKQIKKLASGAKNV
jgi:hypothetical protein